MRSACMGIKGFLFGHCFEQTVGWTVYDKNYCIRCGMPIGGWKSDK